MHAAKLTAALASILPALVSVAMIGCDSEDATDGSSLPFADERLEVVVPKGIGAEKNWPRILDEWSARSGGTFHIESYTGESEMSLARFVQSRVATEKGDSVVVFPWSDLPELAEAGLVRPIPAEQRRGKKLAWLEIFSGLREGVCRIERDPAVLPISSPVLICYYRRDLLEQAGLSPPETWQEYAELVASLDQWAPDLTAVEPWGPSWRATMYLARAVSYCRHPENYSLYFDIQSGLPLMHGPGFVRALDEARTTRIKLAPECMKYTPADCRREFFAGRAALAIAFETGPDNPPLRFPPHSPKAGTANGGDPNAVSQPMNSQRDDERPAAMRAGFAPLPGVREVFNYSTGEWEATEGGRVHRVTLTGFAGLGAAVVGPKESNSSNSSEAAWDLSSVLTVEEVAAAFPPGARTPCRESELSTPAHWVGKELVGSEGNAYLAAVERSLNAEWVVAELPIVNRERFRDALSIALEAALTGKSHTAGALGAVSAAWEAILKQVGPRRVLDSYRRSLGLRPSTGR